MPEENLARISTRPHSPIDIIPCESTVLSIARHHDRPPGTREQVREPSIGAGSRDPSHLSGESRREYFDAIVPKSLQNYARNHMETD